MDILVLALAWLVGFNSKQGLDFLFSLSRWRPAPPPRAPPTPEPEEEMDGRKTPENIERLRMESQRATEARLQLIQQRKEALAKGQEILTSQASLDEKKSQLVALAAQYPRVSEGVARQLNRQFGISKMLGVSENDLMQELAGAVAQIGAAGQGEKQEGAAGQGESPYF